jgi:hypothetical protein
MFLQKAGVSPRFSLLLLDEGECYLGNYPGTHRFGDRDPTEGKLRICSHSIIFDPDDVRLPIVRIKYEKIEGLDATRERIDDGDIGAADVGDSSDPTFVNTDDDEMQAEPIPEDDTPVALDDDEGTDASNDTSLLEAANDDLDEEDSQAGGRLGGLRKRGKNFGPSKTPAMSLGKSFGSAKKGMGKSIGSSMGMAKGAAKGASDMAKKGIDSSVDAAKKGIDSSAGMAKKGIDSSAGMAKRGIGSGMDALSDASDKAKKSIDVAKDKSGVGHMADKSGMMKGLGAARAGVERAKAATTAAASAAADKTGVSAMAEKSGLSAAVEKATEGFSRVSALAEEGLSVVGGLKTGLAERMGLVDVLEIVVGINITCKGLISMRENNIIGPYQVEKSITEHTFVLAGNMEDIFIQLATLYQTAQDGGSRFAWQFSDTVQKMVDDREASMAFDVRHTVSNLLVQWIILITLAI